MPTDPKISKNPIKVRYLDFPSPSSTNSTHCAPPCPPWCGAPAYILVWKFVEFSCYTYFTWNQLLAMENQNLFFCRFRGSWFWFLVISVLVKCKNSLKLKTVKIAYFETSDLLKLISRKIWVAEKLPNFNTVVYLLVGL